MGSLVVTYESTNSTATAAAGRAAAERRRAELGKFLRARRARLSPGDFGLAPGSRRRTPGLRREEVALLAGVGVTWYTWLEQGRSINASVQVLDAVAQTLRLDRTEREHLYRLAEAVPVHAMTAATGIPDAIAEVVESLTPLPAALANSRFDVIKSNHAHKMFFDFWHVMPCVHRNMLWCAITEPTARDKLLNYDQEVPYLVARLRCEYGRHVGDKDWEEDIARLSRLSSEFVELWSRHEVAEPQPRIRRFVHPQAGEMTFVVNELELPAMPGHRLIVYTPDEDETRRALHNIVGSNLELLASRGASGKES